MLRLIILLLIIPYFASAQYCPSAATNLNYSEIISTVQIGNIVTGSGTCALYTDNTTLQMPTFQPGDIIPILVETQKCGGFWWFNLFNARGCKIFMDWNNNGDFTDLGETVYVSPTIYNDWTCFFLHLLRFQLMFNVQTLELE